MHADAQSFSSALDCGTLSYHHSLKAAAAEALNDFGEMRTRRGIGFDLFVRDSSLEADRMERKQTTFVYVSCWMVCTATTPPRHNTYRAFSSRRPLDRQALSILKWLLREFKDPE